MSDLKLAFRALFKTPFVTSVAVLSLALGIGANTAMFSMFDRVLRRPLPVADPAALVNFSAPGPKQGSTSCNGQGDCDQVFSYPMFRDLQHAQTVFTDLAAHRLIDVNLAFEKQTLSGLGLLISGSYFPVLGVRPALGRLIGPGDDRQPGESAVVVLSYGYWRARFGARSDVVGKAMVVNGHSMDIVGVAPRGFEGTAWGSKPEVFVPITMRAAVQPGLSGFEDRREYWAYLFARLRPGVPLAQAAAAINGPFHALLNDVEAPLQSMSPQTLERFKARQLKLEPGSRGQSAAFEEARSPLSLLLGVTALVLLIACANIANLLLARGAARSADVAVRLSIGASRWHIVRQLLVESCVLAVMGAAAGLVVARWTLDGVVSLLPAEAGRGIRFDLDLPVLVFAGLVALLTGVLFGLFPALHTARVDLLSALKGQAGQPSGSKSAARFRTTLAVSQIALSMALLASAGFFIKSLLNVARVDLGMRIDHLVTFAISPELNGYTPAQSSQLFERLEDELGALPGVVSATASRVPLISGSNWGSNVTVQGFEAGPDTDTESRFNEIGPGYFATLGIPLQSGREFTRADGAGAPRVAIVNEMFARKFNLGRDAVGKRMKIGGGPGPLDIEIVGLVRDTTYSSVKGEVPPVFFPPYRQDAKVGTINFYVRTSLDPESLLTAIPSVVARLDPRLPVDALRTMRQQVRENVFIDRMLTTLATAFALLATLLASVGLYGVLAYTVAQRTREIGVRMALGADAPRVRRMVLRQVGVMTLIGGVAGLGAAMFLGRAAQSLLYRLAPWEPSVIGGAIAALALVALAAGFIPAQRAARIDPIQALRYE